MHPGAYLQVGARDSGRLDVRKDVLKVRLSQVHVGIGRVGVCSTTAVVPSVSSGSLRSIHAIDRLLRTVSQGLEGRRRRQRLAGALGREVTDGDNVPRATLQALHRRHGRYDEVSDSS